MKKGEVLEGVVKRLDFPNKGIVETAEGICVVKNVIPGQKISLRVQKKRSNKAEGQCLEVLEKAPDEVESDCPHFGQCGGCTYRNLSYERQCELKEQQVHALLDPVLAEQEEPYEWEKIHVSPATHGYRNKMEFSFGDAYKDGPLALGMHKRGSFYDIETVANCQIVDADYRAILCAVRDFFDERKVPFFHRLRHTGYLRHLLVRKAVKTGQILLALVTTSQIEPAVEEVLLHDFLEMLQALSLEGCFAGILHTVNDSVADVIQSDRTDVLYGEDYFCEELLGLKFGVTEFSFFQTNSLGAEVLYQTAREYIGDLGGKDKIVFDLYSGTGTIAQLMAPVAGKVVGVEIVEEAVEAAKENAKKNGLTNCEFIAGDVLKVLDDIEEKPDFIILDPPRDGIHPKAIHKILSYGVDRMIYISCKPTSLARDLVYFREAGYHVERVTTCDQFPWTANVETCCLLVRECAHDDEMVSIKVDLQGIKLNHGK